MRKVVKGMEAYFQKVKLCDLHTSFRESIQFPKGYAHPLRKNCETWLKFLPLTRVTQTVTLPSKRSNKRSELWKPKRDYRSNWIFVSVEIYGRLFPLRFLRDHANISTCVLLFWDCYPSTKQCRRGQCPLNHEILDLRGRPTATVQKLCHFGRSFPFGSYQIPEWSDSRWKMVLRMTRALMILERMPPNLMSRNSMKKKLRN